ncbi:MAG: hypothetical protein JNL32_09145, partial [Candidatus Kapabacteria bacterium]|nr:hypothetical protein [Candidatus Kapabacteria bacterium]
VLGSVTEKVQWETIHGGDGFYTVVDPRNSNIIYTENYNGSMVTVNVGNGSRTSNMQGIDDQETAAWSAPIVLDREGGGLYHGRKRVSLQILGTNRWEKYSPLLDTSTFISAIGPSSKSLDICWAGTQNGNLYLTKVGGEEWKNVSFKGLPKRWIRDVIASAKDERRAWVCYSGFGTGHIFRTDNLGESWTDISTVLPDVPVNAIVVHPQNEDVIMAGTDVGVFISYNNGGSWMPLGRGCPRSPVLDMEFYDEKNLLRIGTHGRSMWEVEVNAAAPVTEPEITSPMGGDVVMATASMVFSWSGFDGPVDVDVSYSNGEYWSKAATGVIGNSMRWVVQNRPTAYARIRVTSVTDKNKSMVSNTFTILEFTRGSVQTTTSVAHVAYGIAYDGNNGLWTTSFYTNKMYKLNATTMQIERELEMPAGNDKNFTDMTIDRERGHIYVHRLLDPSRDNTGARVVVVDTNGKLIRTMISPSYGYGIALELVDGKLIVGERNGSQKFYICNPNDAENPTSSVDIPFKEYYGPRCIAYDGKELIYLIGTQFSPGGGGLQAAYALRISKGNLAKEVERMELINSSGATINARGIEIDPRDNNYWITDLEGNIFKIANFSTKSDPLSDVKSETATLQSSGILIQPNPATNQAFIGYMTGTVNAYVSLEVYDVLGNRIATLVDGRITDDMNTAAVLDCSSLANGVYSVVLTVDGTRRPAEKLMIAR